MSGTAPIAVLAIKASLLMGYYLYKRFDNGGPDAAYDAVATVSSAFWVLAGIFAIMGGFVVVGAVLIILFSYIGFAKGTATKKRLRRRIAG